MDSCTPQPPVPPYQAGQELIFLTGCPRSGTTWLQLLISRHPQILSGPESYFFDSCIRPALNTYENFERLNKMVGLRAYHDPHQFDRLMSRFSYDLLSPALDKLKPGQFFLEKTPKHALSLPLIRRILPEARIIHITRDPRSVAASLLAASQSWGSHWAPRFTFLAALRWRHFFETVKKSVPLQTTHFLSVDYESLHAQTEKTLRHIFCFLNLKADDQMIQSIIQECALAKLQKTGEQFSTFRSDPASGYSISTVHDYNTHFFRKGSTCGWQSELNFWQIMCVELITMKQLLEAGYKPRFSFLRQPALILNSLMEKIFLLRKNFNHKAGLS
jgi:hypothetical protein